MKLFRENLPDDEDDEGCEEYRRSDQVAPAEGHRDRVTPGLAECRGGDLDDPEDDGDFGNLAGVLLILRGGTGHRQHLSSAGTKRQPWQVASAAAGVETRERLDLVRRLGCTDAQGFFYSKPMSAVTCQRCSPSGARSASPRRDFFPCDAETISLHPSRPAPTPPASDGGSLDDYIWLLYLLYEARPHRPTLPRTRACRTHPSPSSPAF